MTQFLHTLPPKMNRCRGSGTVGQEVMKRKGGLDKRLLGVGVRLESGWSEG